MKRKIFEKPIVEVIAFEVHEIITNSDYKTDEDEF